MPNIKISALPPVTLPLDAANVFFEVQATEAGEDVSRRVSALNLGAAFGLDASFITVDPNGDLPNERVLTAGANIEIVDGGPDTILTIQLPGALTGVSVNGVTLSDAGAATDFLNEEGNYVAIGGGGDPNIDTFNYQFSTDLDAFNDPGAGFIRFNNATPSVSTIMAISTTDADGNDLDPDVTRWEVGEVITIRDPADSTQFVRYSRIAGAIIDGGTWFRFPVTHITGDTYPADSADITTQLRAVPQLDAGNVLSGTILVWNQTDGRFEAIDNNWRLTTTGGVSQLGTNQNLRIQSAFRVEIRQPLYFQEQAADGGALADHGQFWVRNTLDGEPMFTDDQGVDTVLNVSGGVTSYDGRTGAVVPVGGVGADWDLPTTLTTLWQIDNSFTNFRLINSTDLQLFSAGDTEDVRFSLTASLMQITGSGFNPPDLTFQIQNWVGFDVNVQSYFQPSVTVGGNSNPGSGASINIPHGAVPSTPLNGDVWTTTAGYFARINGVTIDLAGGGALTPWIEDIDGAGFNLEGAGVIFLESQLVADPDVSGQGQIWVEGVPSDPLWAEVELLADYDGADGATSYTEISVNTASATFFGTAQLDTAEFNSGVSSLLLDGNSDWITFPDIAAYDLGTQSWTFEGFVRFNTLPPLQASLGPGFVIWDMRQGGNALVQYGIIQDAFGFRVRLVGDDWGAELGTIVGGIVTGVWYHWAVTRDVGGDGNIRAYFNGNAETADFGVSPADMGNPDEPIIIGSRDATDAFMDGWLDDYRMTMGTARYTGTGSYTPPSTPYLGAPIPVDLFFTDDFGTDFQLNVGGGGQVDSIVAGTAITVNAGDPVNPIVAFDTLTNLTFFAVWQFNNSLRLRYATAEADVAGVGQIFAAADDLFFVDDDGVSTSLLGGGGVGISGTPVNNQIAIWVNATDIEGDAAVTFNGVAFIVDGEVHVDIDPGSGGLGLFMQNGGAGTEIFGITATGAGGIDLDFINVTVVNFNGGGVYDFSGGGLRLVGQIHMSERAAAAPDITGQGQFWVRTEVPNVSMFADDDGVEQVIDPSISEINTQNGNYTLLIGDKGKTIYKASGGAGETITIPANSSVAFKIGTWVAFDNDGGGDLTIAITTDVLVGTDGATGSRTLGDNHRALIQKITATRWRYQASDL